jgi:predicted phosphodiesterase
MSGWRRLLDDEAGNPGSGAAGAPAWVGRPLLCLSDIHGDLLALESVLAAVRGIELGGIVAAGDHCLGGPRPFEVWQRLQSLGAVLARGPTDLALGTLDPSTRTVTSTADEARLLAFVAARQALGDVVCRRLAELPTSVVLSLDDTRGVMVVHGSPADDLRGLDDDDDLDDAVACVAEDVLVTGATHVPFARRIRREPAAVVVDVDDDATVLPALDPPPLLVANAGSVGMSPVRRPDRRRTAHALLIAAGSDGRLHAWGQDVLVAEAARARRTG